MLPAHIVPQSILDVEFKLVGSLTVRQFSYIVATVGLAGVFWLIFSPLPILMWSMITISIVFGLAFAFLRPNDRPFDEWLTNYLLATFSTQRSTYKKEAKHVDFLEDLINYNDTGIQPVKINTPPVTKSLDLSLLGLRNETTFKKDDLDVDDRLLEISNAFYDEGVLKKTQFQQNTPKILANANLFNNSKIKNSLIRLSAYTSTVQSSNKRSFEQDFFNTRIDKKLYNERSTQSFQDLSRYREEKIKQMEKLK